jgi:hypothetical protein
MSSIASALIIKIDVTVVSSAADITVLVQGYISAPHGCYANNVLIKLARLELSISCHYHQLCMHFTQS